MPVKFDPDYNMAVSWQRLADGSNIQEEDLTLLNHENREMSLMKQGFDYDAAHIKASEEYDYAAQIKRKEEKR
jgi:hypothetical protein